MTSPTGQNGAAESPRAAVAPGRNGIQVGTLAALIAGAAHYAAPIAGPVLEAHGVPPGAGSALVIAGAGGCAAFLGIVGSVARNHLHSNPGLGPVRKIVWGSLALLG